MNAAAAKKQFRSRVRRPLGPCLAALLVISGVHASDTAVEFDRDVRPILSDYCYPCHGPDGETRKADLRLDIREGAFADRGGEPILVAGDPKSELLRRLSTPELEDRMPPPSTGRSLGAEQISVLKRWVESGARWETHWAFVAARRPAQPALAEPRNRTRMSSPIDSFVFSRLESEGLDPAPEAERETLIRRLSFDLTGLPPTPREIDEFIEDSSHDAYQRLVERLLHSPRFGERMAIRWLDAARYADTNGYQTDGYRNMWRWRDWVIDAYNRNQPFDQFTVEQIAGDLLPDATIDQIVATGFNRNHRGNAEGGVVPEEFLAEYSVDRVDTTATVWLGLTAGCARCHDHKYDPIQQAEFYQLFAYFNNIPERGKVFKWGNTVPEIPYPTDEQREELERVEHDLERAERRVSELRTELERDQRVWELRTRSVRGGVNPSDFTVTRELLLHHSFDDNPQNTVPGVIGQAGEFEGQRSTELGDVCNLDFLDKFSIGAWVLARGDNGTIVSRMGKSLSRTGYCVELKDGKVHFAMAARWLDDAIRVETRKTLPAGRWHHVLVTYDGTRYAKGLQIYVDGVAQELHVNYDNMVQTMKSGYPFLIGGRGGTAHFDGQIDDVRVYQRCLEPQEAEILATGDKIDVILARSRESRSPFQSQKLGAYFLEYHAPEHFRVAHRRLESLRREKQKVTESFPTVMVMKERETLNETHVLVRGEYDKPGKKVTRGVPSFLPALPGDAENNRLGLARWLVQPSNPLTARVAVNRLWQMIFGTGLVRTTEDFGAQGERPSHPLLLDWLATEFVSIRWNVKGIIRTIVNSATYRQSSRVTPELLERDPENRLLARGSRYRLSAEMIRDQVLAFSGLLVERLGGPSVKPYQPPGLWKEISSDDVYEQGQGEDLYRRSMYTFWKRTVAPPSMITFDAAGREACQVNESRTNTPLQALNLMNDVTYVEAARVAAESVILDGPSSDEESLRRAFRLTTARWPEESELTVLLKALEVHRETYRDAAKTAKTLVTVGEYPRAANIDTVELAAFTAVMNLILNLDEVITKE